MLQLKPERRRRRRSVSRAASHWKHACYHERGQDPPRELGGSALGGEVPLCGPRGEVGRAVRVGHVLGRLDAVVLSAGPNHAHVAHDVADLRHQQAEAIEDGDSIIAVIRGIAINNDGSDKVGYMAPSVSGQAEVIAMAHAMAGVEPDEISYVEGHGTATPLGDPIAIEFNGCQMSLRLTDAKAVEVEPL